MISVFKSFTSEQKPTTSYTVSESCHVQSNLELPVCIQVKRLLACSEVSARAKWCTPLSLFRFSRHEAPGLSLLHLNGILNHCIVTHPLPLPLPQYIVRVSQQFTASNLIHNRVEEGTVRAMSLAREKSVVHREWITWFAFIFCALVNCRVSLVYIGALYKKIAVTI